MIFYEGCMVCKSKHCQDKFPCPYVENQPKENHFKEVDEKSLLQILLFLQDKKKSYDLQTFEKQNDKC